MNMMLPIVLCLSFCDIGYELTKFLFSYCIYVSYCILKFLELQTSDPD